MSATNEPTQAAVPAEGTSAQPSATELSRRLYIGNLAYSTSDAELRTFFKDFLV